ncbi:MD-2-related lipid-recognition domain-containing protein [Panaeolus papilionaceus]|nr:MD-2-related lipid-recognition domain-containing protein [Panaeolus papilionaceus]
MLNQVSPAGQVHTYEGWSYTNCGLDTDPIQFESIKLSPDPPKPGQDLTVKVTGSTKKNIKVGAYAEITVKLGLIKIFKKEVDLCEEARKANVSIQCPIEPGKYTIEHTVAMPKEIPQAKFTVGVRAYTVDHDDLFCLAFMVDFMKRPFFQKF